MARTSPRRNPSRSSREWAFRGGLAAVAMILGYISTTQTLAHVLVRTDPTRAYALAPNDGRFAGALAQQIAATSDASPVDRRRADRLARGALAAESLAVSALTALALDAQIGGDTGRARRLFVHSDILSRRELGTRLWLIEDAVARGDVPRALRQYDIALRTEKSAPELLFPIMAQAIEDDAIATGLLRTLTKRPAWAESFIRYLGGANANPVSNARLLRRLAAAGVPVAEVAQVGAINNLIVSDFLEEGWDYYKSVRLNVDRRVSRDSEFNAKLSVASVLDWTPVMSEPGISATIDGGLFDFAAPATVGGVVLQQIQLLPPGRYAISGISANINQTSDARPYWQLVCFDGRDLGKVDLPASPDVKTNFAGTFVVPSGCRAQTLRLVVRPSTAVGGSTGQIERVALAPTGLLG